MDYDIALQERRSSSGHVTFLPNLKKEATSAVQTGPGLHTSTTHHTKGIVHVAASNFGDNIHPFILPKSQLKNSSMDSHQWIYTKLLPGIQLFLPKEKCCCQKTIVHPHLPPPLGWTALLALTTASFLKMGLTHSTNKSIIPSLMDYYMVKTIITSSNNH
jgi:hypothetical protein